MSLSDAQVNELLRRLQLAARRYRRTRLGYEDALGFGCLGALEAQATGVRPGARRSAQPLHGAVVTLATGQLLVRRDVPRIG